MKIKTIMSSALAGVITLVSLGAPSTSLATVILAKDAGLSALVDPGNIIADGGTQIAQPGWLIYTVQNIEKPHGAVPVGTEVVRLANDLATNDPQKAKGIVRFDLGELSNGTYALSVLMRTNNFKQGNTTGATDRNLSFAVRLVAEGGATLNGVDASPWFIIKPLKDDRNGGGGVRNMEWFDLLLSGGVMETDAYSVSFLHDESWDITKGLTLSGVNGTPGRFYIEILDPSSANSATLDVARFELQAIPEPATGALLGVSMLFAVGGGRLLRMR